MCVVMSFFFFFSSRRRHTRCREVSWARRCVQETGYQRRVHGASTKVALVPIKTVQRVELHPGQPRKFTIHYLNSKQKPATLRYEADSGKTVAEIVARIKFLSLIHI
eukprot:TRINITY_DN9351_c0_g1_i1.p2 TRINITY_DN9351_c0_g1~~TRINITY_DN9351_c0_g1_i1.p2  ORF type:complete len:107 (+),score=47.16 TRINITY_DN9351_c0_g1_i1:39-359(+)